MYRLNGFQTQNTFKTLYVLEELGVNYEFRFIDLSKGENRTEEFLRLNPFGKLPTLEHDDNVLFESGAICRYLANIENSSLYPEDKFKRAKADQWLDFFTCHLGRWLNNLYFEKIIKEKFNMGTLDVQVVDESLKFCSEQCSIVDQVLEGNTYFVGDELTIADLTAFAYLEQGSKVGFSLDHYTNIKRWYSSIEKRECIEKARARF